MEGLKEGLPHEPVWVSCRLHNSDAAALQRTALAPRAVCLSKASGFVAIGFGAMVLTGSRADVVGVWYQIGVWLGVPARNSQICLSLLCCCVVIRGLWSVGDVCSVLIKCVVFCPLNDLVQAVIKATMPGCCILAGCWRLWGCMSPWGSLDLWGRQRPACRPHASLVPVDLHCCLAGFTIITGFTHLRSCFVYTHLSSSFVYAHLRSSFMYAQPHHC